MAETLGVLSNLGIAGLMFGYFFYRDKVRAELDKTNDEIRTQRENKLMDRVQVIEDWSRLTLSSLLSHNTDAISEFARVVATQTDAIANTTKLMNDLVLLTHKMHEGAVTAMRERFEQDTENRKTGDGDKRPR